MQADIEVGQRDLVSAAVPGRIEHGVVCVATPALLAKDDGLTGRSSSNVSSEVTIPLHLAEETKQEDGPGSTIEEPVTSNMRMVDDPTASRSGSTSGSDLGDAMDGSDEEDEVGEEVTLRDEADVTPRLGQATASPRDTVSVGTVAARDLRVITGMTPRDDALLSPGTVPPSPSGPAPAQNVDLDSELAKRLQEEELDHIGQADDIEPKDDKEAVDRPVKWKIGACAAALVAFTVALLLLPVVDSVILPAAEFIQSASPFVSVLLFSVLYVPSVLLFVPRWLMDAMAGFVFGAIWGVVVVAPLILTAAAIAYVLGRTLLRPYLEKRLQREPRYAAIDAAMHKHGIKLVILMRLGAPFPFSINNYVISLGPVPFQRYLTASFIGMIPWTTLYVVIGSIVGSLGALATGDSAELSKVTFWTTMVTIAVTVMLIVSITHIARSALARYIDESQEELEKERIEAAERDRAAQVASQLSLPQSSPRKRRLGAFARGLASPRALRVLSARSRSSVVTSLDHDTTTTTTTTTADDDCDRDRGDHDVCSSNPCREATVAAEPTMPSCAEQHGE